MTGPEHYREAERLLSEADRTVDPYGDAKEGNRQIIATAHVHATLAVVAALTGSSDNREWHSVAWDVPGRP